jgi:predicted dithiol-disulfide oxidoreductase (DUF899 family)
MSDCITFLKETLKGVEGQLFMYEHMFVSGWRKECRGRGRLCYAVCAECSY